MGYLVNLKIKHKQEKSKMKTRHIVALVLGVLVLALLPASCTVIEDGQAGVKFVLGKVNTTPMSSGIKFYIPFITSVEKWNVKTQEEKETANVPSSEGLISTLDVSVLYSIPPEKTVSIRTTVGKNYKQVVLVPTIRDAIRNIASGYEVKALFSDIGRTEIASKLITKLKEKLEPHGIMVSDVLLRDVKLPKTFQDSIETKLQKEQESLQMKFELEKAEKMAQVEVERAKGVAESNEIIADSITENYLRYLFIQGLHDGSSEVIYVPTEANLPILEATRRMN